MSRHNNHQYVLITVLFFLLCISVKGQIEPVYNVPGPEVAGLGQYGTVPVSLFTGVPDISIPLHNIKVGSFEMPIKACYHISSVKPTSVPSSLGLGWNLDAGGYITRTVRGIYDEQQDADGVGHGFYSHYEKMQDVTASAFEFYMGNINSYAGMPYYEVAADEFAFNFCGYTGNFYLNEYGEWTVVSDQDIKVEFDASTGFMDLNTFKTRLASIKGWEREEQNNRFFCSFTIITPDGCRYKFGGIDAIEFSVPYYSRKTNDIFPTTWYLSEITTTEQKKITFSYDTTSLMCDIRYNPQTHKAFTDGGEGGFWFDHQNSIEYVKNWGRRGLTGFLLYGVNISKISTPYETIRFDYFRDQAYGSRFTSRDYLLYWKDKFEIRGGLYFRPESPSSQFDIFINAGINPTESSMKGCRKIADSLKSMVLHRISIHGVGLQKSIYFDYEYINHRKLSFITERKGIPELKMRYTRGEGILIPAGYEIPQNTSILNIPEYHFYYNTANRIPRDYAFAATDSWGYYNGSEISLASIPYFGKRTSEQCYNEAEILKAIRYPTGGVSEFEYQQNCYSKRVNSSHTSIDNKSGSSGGLRIKQITNKDRNGEVVNKKRYYYSYRKVDGSESSGISKGEPCHRLEYRAGYNYLQVESYGGFFSTSTCYNSPDVGYSCVYEETLDKNGLSQGYIKYRFTNYDTDIYGNQHMDTPYLYACNISGNCPITPVSSNSHERGKLLSKEYFTNDGTVIKKECYKYILSNHADVKTAHQSLILFVNEAYDTQMYKVGWMTNTHTNSYLLESVTDSIKGSGNYFTSRTTRFTYNSHKMVSQEQKLIHNNLKEKINYSYPYNFSKYAWMTDRHILSPIVQTKTCRGNFDKTTICEYSQIEYDGGIIPYIKKRKTLYGTIAKTDYEVLQTDYDGNPIEIKEGDKYSVLAWDNRGHLIARVEDCTADEVISAVSRAFPDIYGYEPWYSAFEFEEEKELRSMLPKKNIYLYSYDSGGHLYYESSPNGKSTCYDYDVLGRLKKEYYRLNDEIKIIKQYDYRYYSGTGTK